MLFHILVQVVVGSARALCFHSRVKLDVAYKVKRVLLPGFTLSLGAPCLVLLLPQFAVFITLEGKSNDPCQKQRSHAESLTPVDTPGKLL
jgi:hypothetical protein